MSGTRRITQIAYFCEFLCFSYFFVGERVAAALERDAELHIPVLRVADREGAAVPHLVSRLSFVVGKLIHWEV